MHRLPPECLSLIVRHVDTTSDLYSLLYVNKFVFTTAVQCLWYDPLEAVTKTQRRDVSLIRLLRVIYIISTSEHKDVKTMQRFFKWAATEDSKALLRGHWFEPIFRDPLASTSPSPLADYLCLIGSFDVFTLLYFHEFVREAICGPLSGWFGLSLADTEDNNDDTNALRPYDRADQLAERSLLTALCGHRLPRLKRVSMAFRYLDHYLGSGDMSSPPLSMLPNLKEIVWDMSQSRMHLWEPILVNDPTMVDQIMARLHQCQQRFKWLHTVELEAKDCVFNDEYIEKIDKMLIERLPPLPTPRRLHNKNMDRVFARWKDTDLSQVAEFKFTNVFLQRPRRSIQELRHWMGAERGEATLFHDQADSKGQGHQGAVLQRLRSLRHLEFEAGDDSVFDWAVKEKFRKDRGEAVQLVPLRAITVYCQLDHVERIANDAAVAFGETLEKLDIRVDEASNPPESFDASKTATKIIRIGHGWRLPRLSYLALDGTKEALLDIDPTFLGHTTCLAHLELVDGCLEEDAPEDDEIRMPTLHASRMQRLRLIGTACWLFDPASLVSMCDSLKYLELRNQGCVSTTGPDCKHWRWQEWSFPQLHQLNLEGSAVASFPWHKMTEYPQLQSVYFGAGPHSRKVKPWLEEVAQMTSDATNNIKDHVALIGSSVEQLELKGAWLLTASTLQTLVQDICPKLNTLSLEHCKGHTGEDLCQILKDRQRHLCIVTSRYIDAICKNPGFKERYTVSYGDRQTFFVDYTPCSLSGRKRFVLQNKISS